MIKTTSMNLKSLKSNIYPGRGIIIGLSPDLGTKVQVYWIMGRSENSRNRIFVLEENKDVQNKAFDESKLTDPSLIIYKPIRSLGKVHIVSNGDQSDTIHDSYSNGDTFDNAILTRKYEPDSPNYTPRISGVVDLRDSKVAYKLSIIKSLNNSPEVCIRNTFSYSQAIGGIGHCITTYKGDGTPLPSFEGEPSVVPITNNVKETLELYWDILNEENRISVLVKHIDIATNHIEVKIKNKL